MATIGQRLKEVRDRLGLSQPKFAAIGGVKKHAQIDYEADRSSPDAKYLAAIAAEFGIDILYIVTGESRPKEQPRDDLERWSAAITAVEEGLARTRRRLDPPAKAELILAAYDLLEEDDASSTERVIRLVNAS